MKANSFQDLKVQILLERSTQILYQNCSCLYAFMFSWNPVVPGRAYTWLCMATTIWCSKQFIFLFQIFIISQPMKKQQYQFKLYSARNSSFCFKIEFKAHWKIIHYNKTIATQLGRSFFVWCFNYKGTVNMHFV